jgi:hypothetical protein
MIDLLQCPHTACSNPIEAASPTTTALPYYVTIPFGSVLSGRNRVAICYFCKASWLHDSSATTAKLISPTCSGILSAVGTILAKKLKRLQWYVAVVIVSFVPYVTRTYLPDSWIPYLYLAR